MRLPSRSSFREAKKSPTAFIVALRSRRGWPGSTRPSPRSSARPWASVAVAALAAWLAGSTYAVAVIVPVS